MTNKEFSNKRAVLFFYKQIRDDPDDDNDIIEEKAFQMDIADIDNEIKALQKGDFVNDIELKALLKDDTNDEIALTEVQKVDAKNKDEQQIYFGTQNELLEFLIFKLTNLMVYLFDEYGADPDSIDEYFEYNIGIIHTYGLGRDDFEEHYRKKMEGYSQRLKITKNKDKLMSEFFDDMKRMISYVHAKSEISFDYYKAPQNFIHELYKFELNRFQVDKNTRVNDLISYFGKMTVLTKSWDEGMFMQVVKEFNERNKNHLW